MRRVIAAGMIGGLLTLAPPNLSGQPILSAGADHSLVVTSSGEVWAWGNNQNGQLGNDSNVNQWFPQVVQYAPLAIAASGGHRHTIVAATDGTVWTWGLNSSGQLGHGDTINRALPAQVTGLSGITKVAAGNSHTLARKSDGSLWAWGSNANGRLGDGSTTQSSSPVAFRLRLSLPMSLRAAAIVRPCTTMARSGLGG